MAKQRGILIGGSLAGLIYFSPYISAFILERQYDIGVLTSVFDTLSSLSSLILAKPLLSFIFDCQTTGIISPESCGVGTYFFTGIIAIAIGAIIGRWFIK